MASVLTDLTTKPAIKLLVGPPTTMRERNMLSEFRVHSSIPMSEPSVLIGLRTESAKKLLLAASGGKLGSRGKESQTAWPLCAWTSVDRGVRRHCSLWFRVNFSIPISELSVLIDLTAVHFARTSVGDRDEWKNVLRGRLRMAGGRLEVVCLRMAGGRLLADGRRSSACGWPEVVCLRMAG